MITQQEYLERMTRRTQTRVIGSLFAVNAVMLVIFAGVLGWI